MNLPPESSLLKSLGLFGTTVTGRSTDQSGSLSSADRRSTLPPSQEPQFGKLLVVSTPSVMDADLVLLEKRIEAGLQNDAALNRRFVAIDSLYGAYGISSPMLVLTDEETLIPEQLQTITEAFKRDCVEVPEMHIPQEKPWIAMNQYNTKGRRKHR